MRIRVDDAGLHFDGVWVAPIVGVSQRGGALRYETLPEESGEEPTSRVTRRWSGWHVRRFVFRVVFIARPGDPLFSHRALGLLNAATYGTEQREGQELPQRHTLEGPFFQHLGVDNPVIIESLESERPKLGNTLSASFEVFEENPELVTLTSRPAPPAPDPVTDPDPAPLLDTDDQDVIAAREE